MQVVGDGVAVFEGQKPGEIDPHQVVFLGPQIGGGGQIVVRAPVLGVFDPPQDLLLGLGVDPHPFSLFALDPGHLVHQAVDVLSLPPGVGADVDGVHILTVQQRTDDLELFADAVNDLIFKFFG